MEEEKLFHEFLINNKLVESEDKLPSTLGFPTVNTRISHFIENREVLKLEEQARKYKQKVIQRTEREAWTLVIEFIHYLNTDDNQPYSINLNFNKRITRNKYEQERVILKVKELLTKHTDVSHLFVLTIVDNEFLYFNPI